MRAAGGPEGTRRREVPEALWVRWGGATEGRRRPRAPPAPGGAPSGGEGGAAAGTAAPVRARGG